MRNLYIKKVTRPLLTLCLTALFLTSCSSSDDNEAPAVSNQRETPVVSDVKVAPVVFTSITTNKTDVFTEEAIILNLVASDFTDAQVTSSNSSVVIKKISSTIYEIASTTAASANIYVQLSNGSDKKSRSVTLNFHEHGVKNFNTAEGIRVNIDKSSKVVSLLGEPNQKSTSPNGLYEHWAYSSKGFSIIIVKSSSIVDSISILSSNYYITLENGAKLNYTNYPYEIGNDWKINNANTTVDAVITKLGTPTEKISSSDPASTLRTYVFTSQSLHVSFSGTTIDDYTGKTIRSIIIY